MQDIGKPQENQDAIILETSFSKIDTLFCKGIAICVMLFHHLFFREESWGKYFWVLEFHDRPIISILAFHGKICVALFVFLSAYGLTISYESHKGKKQNRKVDEGALKCRKRRQFAGGYCIRQDFAFIATHVKRLYFQYWPIFLVSFLVSAVTGAANFKEIYVSVSELARDFLGVAYIFDGESPFIGAWWYISFAILLYLAFPLLYRMVMYLPRISFVAAFLCGCFLRSRILILLEVQRYLFVAVLAILFIKEDWFGRIFQKKKAGLLMLSGIGCVFFFLVRCIRDFTFDAFFAASILIFCKALFCGIQSRVFVAMKRIVIFLGQHSGNIFMIHGLFYRILMPDFIYGFRFPVLIFCVLLSISLVFSVALEWEKRGMIEVIKVVTGRIHHERL